MSSTFTSLLRTLKSTSSPRDSSLLSSCETELTELMHQIDIMVEKKRLEWEHQLHGMQIQCQQREQEVAKLREVVEMRNKEVGQFQQRILGEEEKHKSMISQYEQQLGKLRSEMDNLKKNYGKLERNSTKQSSDVEILKEQLCAEREKAAQEIHQAKLTIEDWKDKVREMQTTHEVEEAKTKAMEQQRKSLLEKSQLMQEQLLSYQGQLNRKKQLMDNLEQKHVSTIAQLQNEILQYKDEIETQNDTIHDLKRSLENARSVEEINRRDRKLLKQENENLIHRFKQKEKDLHDLEQEIHAFKRNAKKQDSGLRNATDSARIKLTEDSELVKKLKQSIKEYQQEIRVKSVQEEVLLQKSKEQKQRLVQLEQQYEDLRKEITRQVLTDREVSKGNQSTQKKDFIRLQNLLHQKESEYQAEIAGMKNQVTSLAQDLHHRDAALADMSKRAARMEEDLRDISSKHDKKDAELQVSNAQLQALRLENRHLRDSSMEEHLSTTADLRMFETHISEIENANARVIAQLEDENAYLKHEIEAIRDDKGRQVASANNQSLNRSRNEAVISNPHDQSTYEGDTQERIASLQEQLDTTIKHYEKTIQELDAENRILKESASKEQGRPEINVSMKKNEWTHIDVDSPHNSTKMNNSKPDDETEFTTVLDILGSESFSSGNNSRRVSFTKAFMMEEGEREKELDELLETRIMDLEAKTNATMKKYQL